MKKKIIDGVQAFTESDTVAAAAPEPVLKPEEMLAMIIKRNMKEPLS